MKVERVKLLNFRNYNDIEITFQEGLNVICGKNASGKTNLMESIFVAGIGRSPRTSNEKELIKWESEKAYIYIEIKKKYRSHTIKLEINRNGNKKIKIDDTNISRLGELVGILGIVYFSPDELKMIKDAPSERRKFMDLSLAQQSKTYYYNLSKYNKLLLQRNKLIKTTSFCDFCTLAQIWEIQIAEEAAKIIKKRKEFIQKISVIACDIHKKIAGENDDLQLIYETCNNMETEEEIKKEYLEKLTKNHKRDYEIGYTTYGIHREDFNILSKDIELRKFGSQGQQRTAALAIKLAEIEYFYKESGEKPVLLLDDVLSELDESRRKALLNATIGTQTLITCTEFNENEMEYNKIIINN